MRIIIVALLITMLFSLLFATYDKDIDHLISDAENGDMEAQYILGLSYYRGEGVEKNSKQAVYWYEKAANLGDADAQYNLGSCYANGEGVVKNYKQAVYWYEKAANQG
ncbi:MAG: tetratricopeptide repeat protein, partial [Candidatus Cloacimonadales bacterium]|nr:sel1 repeat family protein [Candidatus Cloacimonadota bacterium]